MKGLPHQQAHRVEEGEEVRVRETVHVGSRCGRDVSVRTIESVNPDGSRLVVTATTDAATQNVTVEATKFPIPECTSVDEEVTPIGDGAATGDETRTTPAESPPALVDAEGDMEGWDANISQAPAQAAPGSDDCIFAGGAPLNVLSPTALLPHSDDIKAQSRDSQEGKPAKPHCTKAMQHTGTVAAPGGRVARPELAPIEDPVDREAMGGGRHDTAMQRKNRKRSSPQPTAGAVGATSVGKTADWKARKNPRPEPRVTQDVPELFNNEPTPNQGSTDHQAPLPNPGAVAIPGIASNDDGLERADPERPGQGTAQDTSSTSEAAEAPQEATLQNPIEAYAINEGRARTATTRHPRVEGIARDHLVANTPLLSARNVHDHPENSALTMQKCSPKNYSRRTWAMFALFIAIIVSAATLMGVLIPRAQEETQSPASIPTTTPTTIPSLLPSLTPTFDPDAFRFRSIQSILMPISGLEMLLNTSTPQHSALEWVSLLDQLRLPYSNEADRKHIVQRYVLAALYFASGGTYWINSHHFLSNTHECGWWSAAKANELDLNAEGAFCTDGQEVGEVDQIYMNGNNLTGTLLSELQHLTDLEFLSLPGNKIGGTIPGSIGEMTSLVRLGLEENMLTGTIPESFGNLTHLRYLRLHDNLLNGTIPSVLGQLSSLKILWLDGNSFTGKFPNELCERERSFALGLRVDGMPCG